MTSLLELTDEQAAAVESSASSLVVSAGPGSGKTRVLAARVARLIRCGVAPSSIACLVFTRSAAAGVRSRVLEELGGLGREATITTFHAFAAPRVVPDGCGVATEAQNEAAVRSLYQGETRRPPRDVPGILELRRAIVEHEARMPEQCGRQQRAVDLVLRRLARAKLIPTWDLVPRLLDQALPGKGLDGIEHVLVDEGQDVTAAEGALATALARSSFFGVFDERQSVMRWRGAVGLDVSASTVLELRRTFRFGPAITAVANAIAARFGGGAILAGDVDDEAVRIPCATERTLLEEVSRPGSTLILARTNRECAELARMLSGRGVHVRRDPWGDPFAEPADRFRAVWDTGRAVVSTTHSAKGREADRVLVAMDLESPVDDPEEERVRYVAVTRARRRFVLLQLPETAGRSGGRG